MTWEPDLVIDEALGTFTWTCPLCGGRYYGRLGPEPVSGWEAPVWRLTRDGEGRPTLEPSLGCQGYRAGTCQGHWFVRGGELVPA